MKSSDRPISRPLLLLVAGAKGAVASTLAVAITAMQRNPDTILPSLTTGRMFSRLGPPELTRMAGWDLNTDPLITCIEDQGIVPQNLWKPHSNDLNQIPVRTPPPYSQDLRKQVERLQQDIQTFLEIHSGFQPVFINLLPAGIEMDLKRYRKVSNLYEKGAFADFPDLAFTLAAIYSKIPVVNFTPNTIETPAIISEAEKAGIPIAGRDGKTGQTYFKVALASALKARNLFVDGWYSLNILGNADGINLMSPEKAAGKLANKTGLLDDILGYRVGRNYGVSSHKVHIDYYPPRGDAKEAWDVIDFNGMFGLPMSIRLNLQGRDSILAAPLVLDLGRWVAALKGTGKSGTIPELGFYFKKPVGDNPPLTFEDQMQNLKTLEQACNVKISS